jgi:hypothetical protein
MKRASPSIAGLLFAPALFLTACDSSTPLKATNVSPVAQSLTVFPTTIGPGDSAIVVCSAVDADGDTIVYDWSSDCRIRLKGPRPNDGFLYNQFSNSLIVYPGTCIQAPLDTGWVMCEVRDRRGGYDFAGTVRIIVSQ